MKSLYALSSCLSFFILFVGCNNGNVEPSPEIKYDPYSSDVVLTEVSEKDSSNLKCFNEFYPKEILWGDVGYLGSFYENVSDENVESVYYFDFPFYMQYKSLSIQVIGDDSFGCYQWTFENPSGLLPDQNPNGLILSLCPSSHAVYPHRKLYFAKTYLEFPPLEDLEHPFWIQLRKQMTSEGIPCRITCVDDYIEAGSQKEKTTSFDVVVKPRAESELTLLEQWSLNTLKDDLKSTGELKNSGQSDIQIGKMKYSPWCFTRSGSRKPNAPNNPTTIDGWIQLESVLEPSVMRDEIHTTRLLLEYYASKDGSPAEKAYKTRLIDWFNSFPEVQRAVLTSKGCGFGASSNFLLKNTPLDKKVQSLQEELK